MNTYDPIFDYVHMVADECAPDVDFDENGEPYPSLSYVGHYVIRKLDTLEFPFTKGEYYNNTDVLDFLKAYEIDKEKFWYAILFIYYFTKSKIADGVKMSPKSIDQLHSLLDYLRTGNKVIITVAAENKKKKLVIKEKIALGAIADAIEVNIPIFQEEPEMHLQAINRHEKAKVGTKASSQMAYATARYQALLDELITKGKRAKHTKSTSESVRGERHIDMGMTTEGSLSRLLFISRLMYFSCFTENEEYLLSEEPLNGILKDYKNVEINTISPEHFS